MGARDAARGRWESVLAALNIDLGTHPLKHQPCPKDGKGVDRFRFANREGSGNYFCACSEGEKGGVDLVMCCKGWDFKKAAKEIEKVVGVTPEDKPRRSGQHPRVRLREIAKEAKRPGEAVMAYLTGRKLILPPGIKQVRQRYWDGPNKRELDDFECMAGLVVDWQGKPQTYHLTYLSAGKKADVPAPKKMMTPLDSVTGCAVRLFPIESHIGVAEGIETAISAAMLFGINVWSVINSHGMETFKVPEGVERVTFFGDNDPSFVGQASAYIGARNIQRQTDGLVDCEVKIPEVAGDWNDVLIASLNK